jgi:hypothetical protein
MKWFRLALVPLAAAFIIACLAQSGHATQIGAPNPALFAGCNQSVPYDASTNGATKIVSGNSTQQIYPCGFAFLGSAGSVNVDFVYGTGTNCGTGTQKITPAFQLTTSAAGMVDHLPVYTGLPVAPVGNDVCINTSAGVAVQAIFYYAQF